MIAKKKIIHAIQSETHFPDDVHVTFFQGRKSDKIIADNLRLSFSWKLLRTAEAH